MPWWRPVFIIPSQLSLSALLILFYNLNHARPLVPPRAVTQMLAILASGRVSPPEVVLINNFIQHACTPSSHSIKNLIAFRPMYLHNCLVFLPWILPWSNAYIGLDLAPLSSHLIDPYSSSAQLLVTLTGPSPATFAADNTTKSVPPIEKNQDPDTKKTKPSDTKPQDTSPCPEQEDLDCDECGGQKYDNEEGTFRCVGVRNPFPFYPLT